MYNHCIVGESFSDRCISTYSYAFNGKLHDDDIYGKDNSYNYGMRFYDPRLGRFLSVDPIAGKYPMLTPYQFASNTPIQASDRDGKEAFFEIIFEEAEVEEPIIEAETEEGLKEFAFKSSEVWSQDIIPAVNKFNDAIGYNSLLKEFGVAVPPEDLTAITEVPNNTPLIYTAGADVAGNAIIAGKVTGGALVASITVGVGALVQRALDKDNPELPQQMYGLATPAPASNAPAFTAPNPGQVPPAGSPPEQGANAPPAQGTAPLPAYAPCSLQGTNTNSAQGNSPAANSNSAKAAPANTLKPAAASGSGNSPAATSGVAPEIPGVGGSSSDSSNY